MVLGVDMVASGMASIRPAEHARWIERFPAALNPRNSGRGETGTS